GVGLPVEVVAVAARVVLEGRVAGRLGLERVEGVVRETVDLPEPQRIVDDRAQPADVAAGAERQLPLDRVGAAGFAEVHGRQVVDRRLEPDEAIDGGPSMTAAAAADVGSGARVA